MRPMRRLLLYACIIVALLGLPNRARAEPIVVTGGALTAQGLGNFGSFHLTGAGLDITGSTEMGVVNPTECFLCTAGDVVSTRPSRGPGRSPVQYPTACPSLRISDAPM